jgi:hypothetical protein
MRSSAGGTFDQRSPVRNDWAFFVGSSPPQPVLKGAKTSVVVKCLSATS